MRKLVVLGIAKNISKQVTILKDCLTTILDLHEDSRAYIYENDSTDDTPSLLKALETDSRIKVLCEKTRSAEPTTKALTWDNKACRLERIADARNKCMEMWESADKEDSIVIWMDCDRVTRLNGDPISFLARQLTEVPDKTVVAFFAFSRNHLGNMYDTFAYRDDKFTLGPEIMGQEWWEEAHQKSIIKHVNESPGTHLKVLSACNGLAMYRSEVIRGLRFTAYPNTAMEAYYRTALRDLRVECHKELVKIQDKPITHDRGVCLGRYLFGTEGIWYKNNSGYNQPVVCEWVPFHFEIVQKGYTGLFLIKGWEDVSGH